MKRSKITICCFIVTAIASVVSCTENPVKKSARLDYSTMYEDSFDIFLHKYNPHESKATPYTLEDTLYTELCIAMKTCGKSEAEHSEESWQIIMNRVERLMKISESPEDKIKYLDAKMIALAMKKKYREVWKVQHQMYSLMPEDDPARTISIAMLFYEI